MSSTVEPWLREILRCPACRSTLLDAVDAAGAPALRCAADTTGPVAGCGRTYRFERGVPVLLVDEGELPGPDQDEPSGTDEGGAAGTDEGEREAAGPADAGPRAGDDPA